MAAATKRFDLSGPVGRAALAAAATLVVAVATGFFEPRGLLITLGGALTVTWLTYPRARLESTWRHVVLALGDERDGEDVIAVLKRLARVHRVEGPAAVELALPRDADPFLRRAVALALECADEEELTDLLMAEAQSSTAEGEAARQVLVTLGKLFPAFGLIGTLIGLALLMRHLGGASLGGIGPGLGIAVLTTLYGALLSNVVVLPLATKVATHLAAELRHAQMIVAGAVLLHRKEYPTRVERVLRAHAGRPATGGRHVIQLAERAA
jgi:chemotaxis protein MotA